MQDQLLTRVSHGSERHVPALDPESINHYRHMTAYHFARGHVQNADVLDYGCGAGYGLNFLYRRGGVRSAIGADCSVDAIAYCRRTYPDLSFTEITPGEVPFPESSFMVVLLFQVIEHVPDDLGLLRELRRVLSPGGRLFITTPNATLSGGHPEHPENPHHVREYDVWRLRAACGPVFSHVEELGIFGTYRAGGAGLGAERSFVFRAARKAWRRVHRPRTVYAPPVSLADFGLFPDRLEESLDLLFACRR